MRWLAALLVWVLVVRGSYARAETCARRGMWDDGSLRQNQHPRSLAGLWKRIASGILAHGMFEVVTTFPDRSSGWALRPGRLSR